MSKGKFTDSELLILGLLAEMPRHGYELEQVISERGMREWTQIGFSSIYYVLGKLESRGLISGEKPQTSRSRKQYQLTADGEQILEDQTREALESFQPSYPSLLLGLLHLSALSRNQTLDALGRRKEALAAEIARLNEIHFDQQPLPDHVDLIFEYSLDQLQAELEWLERTVSYLETKTWLDEV